MKTTILIADDSQHDREQLIELLAGADVEIVAQAVNGVEAVTRFRKLRPALVLMDLVMPQMSGIEAGRAILAYDRTAKIIAVSALSHPSVMTEVQQVGMLAFVGKPVDREKLLGEIRAATSR